MQIKTIALTNFMQHKDLQMEFCSFVNIISGHSTAGKTTILRAIRWVLLNDIPRESVRPFKSPKNTETTVSITFEDGTVIGRISSDKINAYTFAPKSGELSRFDNFGKEIPDIIKEYLNLPLMDVEKETVALNIADQHEGAFLLDRPDSFKMKVLNILTGNDKIDRVVQSFNKDLLAINKENKTIKKDLETKSAERSGIEKSMAVKEARLKVAQELYDRATVLDEKYNKTQGIINNILACDINIKLKKEALENIKIPDIEKIKHGKELYEKFVCVQNLSDKTLDAANSLNNLRMELDDIPEVTIEFASVRNTVEKHDRTGKLLKGIEDGRLNIERIQSQIGALEAVIVDSKQKYDTTLRENGVCPTCKRGF